MGVSAEAFEQTSVIDCDVHIGPCLTPTYLKRLSRYVDEPYKSELQNPGGHKGSPYLEGTWSVDQGGKFTTIHEELHSPEDIDKHVREALNIDRPIINSFGHLNTIQETEKAMQFMRGGNDLLLDYYLDEDDDLLGLATVATQDPSKAAEEIDRMGDEQQIVGVFIKTAGSRKPLGHPSFDEIYRAAEDNDLAVVFHGSAGEFSTTEMPVLVWELESYITHHALTHVWQQSLTLATLIVQGVPVKFPDLNFVLLESGISWVPGMMYRLNREYRQRQFDAPLLKKDPEEYIRDSFYFATQPIDEPSDPEHLKHILEMVGVESLVFSSDFPHFDFDNLDEIDRLLRNAFAAEERDTVLHGNAIEAFDLERKGLV